MTAAQPQPMYVSSNAILGVEARIHECSSGYAVTLFDTADSLELLTRRFADLKSARTLADVWTRNHEQ